MSSPVWMRQSFHGPNQLGADFIQGRGGGHLLLLAAFGGLLGGLWLHLARGFLGGGGGVLRGLGVIVHGAVGGFLLGRAGRLGCGAGLLALAVLGMGVRLLALPHFRGLLAHQLGAGAFRRDGAVHRVVGAPGGDAHCHKAHCQRQIEPAAPGVLAGKP